MSQRDAFNDSIIMGNVGADGHSNNIELDLAPQDIIDTEFVDTPPPKKSRKKLYLALAIAGVVLAGGLLTQLSSVQRMLGAPAKPADMAAIEAQEPIISGNPFAAMPDAGKVPAAVLPAAVEREGVPVDAPPLVADSGNGSAEDRLLAQNPGAATEQAPPNLNDSLPNVPGAQVTTQADAAAAAAKAAEEKAAAEKVAAEKAAAEKAKAEQAEKERLAQEKAKQEKAEKEKAEKARIAKERAAKLAAEKRAAERRAAAAEEKQDKSQQAQKEVVREVMTVTAEQIGLRAFTQGQLVVNSGGQDATYRVNDRLPSGERIERIDAVAMTVVTDRSVIRVKN